MKNWFIKNHLVFTKGLSQKNCLLREVAHKMASLLMGCHQGSECFSFLCHDRFSSNINWNEWRSRVKNLVNWCRYLYLEQQNCSVCSLCYNIFILGKQPYRSNKSYLLWFIIQNTWDLACFSINDHPFTINVEVHESYLKLNAHYLKYQRFKKYQAIWYIFKRKLHQVFFF